MLAPMQGLTNKALRSLFIEWVRPDVVFTEIMRVRPMAARQQLSKVDLAEVAASEGGVPLVVQLIGPGRDALVAAAEAAQAAGAVQVNLNMGCPFGRMTSSLSGGGMLKRPADLEEIIPALRRAISCTFSIKVRAGFDDPRQIFSLLPLFEESQVDFLVLHPRTVVQAYQGRADHAITAEVVQKTSIPVIANGDIWTGADAARVKEETQAAGLMLGRGAIADPLLFERARGRAEAAPDRAQKATTLRHYLFGLLPLYSELFCGDMQILCKMKAVLSTMTDATLEKELKQLKRAKTLQAFRKHMDEL